MSKIKICGLSRKEDIDAVNRLKPDYIGFVFAKSKRQVDFETASILKKSLSKDILSVGVFVNADISEIADLSKQGVIDLIQLHGDESEEYILSLRKLAKAPIIKAAAVSCKEDVLQKNDSAADYLLLDAGKGGTGKSFDWNLTKYCRKPYFLAGGINTDNISRALSLKPFCIDASSGAETNGIKDEDKISALIKSVRTFS